MLVAANMPMDPSKPSISNNLFAGPYLDRRAEERENPDWLLLALADPDTRFLPLQACTALVRDTADGGVTLHLLDGQDARVRELIAADSQRAILLGWFRGARCVLLDVAPAAQTGAFSDVGRFEELRPLAVTLASDEAALFAYARALAQWRLTHRYCGSCGATLRAARAGHALVCSGCGSLSFPRMDPAIIVLVSDGHGADSRALLGRQANWPPNRYSTIAGFVEPGESLEDAVRREVLEETGVTLQHVEYRSSQPWPFPASLMLGFVATAAASERPVTRDGELEDARWITRAEVQQGRVLLPPPESISRQLINAWYEAFGPA
jgi:NAD+ diphosphatase